MFFQVETRFLSAAHHFPWTYAFGEENSALLYLNLFCLDPPAKNSNKNCQIVTFAGFLSVQWCGFSCLHIRGIVWLVPRLGPVQHCWGTCLCLTCNYREKITRVIAAPKRSANVWQWDSSHNRPCNRLSHPLPSALSRSSREIFPAPVTNQAVGDLSELWSNGIYHSSISACPALPVSIHFCLAAAEEEWDLLLGESHSLILTKQSGYGLVCISIPAFAGT